MGREAHNPAHVTPCVITYREVAGVVLDSLGSYEASDGEPRGTVGLVTLHDGVAPGHWHVVNHPLMHVALVDTLAKKLQCSFLLLVVSFIHLCAKLFVMCDVVGKFDLHRAKINIHDILRQKKCKHFPNSNRFQVRHKRTSVNSLHYKKIAPSALP